MAFCILVASFVPPLKTDITLLQLMAGNVIDKIYTWHVLAAPLSFRVSCLLLCVLCFYVSCFVFMVFRVVCCVLCFVVCVLCCVLCVLCVVFRVLCFVIRVGCIVFCV